MKKAFLLLAILLAPMLASADDCDFGISINADADFFEEGDKIEFALEINPVPDSYIISYWIEDLEGRIVKAKRNTSNNAKKVFTASSAKGDLMIKAEILEIGCSDTNPSNDYSEKRIAYAGGNSNDTIREAAVMFEIDKNYDVLGNIPGKNIPESRSRNPLKLVPYFLIVLTTLISIVLIWRR